MSRHEKIGLPLDNPAMDAKWCQWLCKKWGFQKIGADFAMWRLPK